MKNIKNKLALLGILAMIGIGMVLAAYFIGISSTKEEIQGERDAEKGIAIILDLEEEINESDSEKTNEIKVEEATLGEPEVSGAADINEEELAARGVGEVEDRGVGGNESERMEDTSAAKSVTVPSPPLIPPPSPPSEGLQQNATSSLNVVVLQEGEVISNETVDLESE